MPNVQNIASPVTLISYGRSGSSLLSKIFELHPDFSMVGETGNFMFDLWKGYEFSTGQFAPSIEDGQWIADDVRAGRMVRASFLSCFPDDKKKWFHKPIGVPIAVSSKFTEEDWDKAATWYWNAINSSFPKAKFFTILRHPFDVVLSAKSYWGFDEGAIWWNYGFMSYLLLHPLCPVEYAISYEEMVLDPESIIKSLFDYIEVPFHEKIMHAFTTVHASSKGREYVASNKFARKNEWSQLDKREINPKYLDIILSLFNKYNKNIELSSDIYADICQEFNKKSAGDINHELVNNIVTQEIILDPNKHIESIHSDHSKKLINREREFYEIFNADQKWITELEEGKQWLTLENDTLKKFTEELQEGIAWHSSQREAWEKVAAEREQFIAELASQLHKIVERLNANDAALKRIYSHRVMRFVNLLSNNRLF